MVDYINSGLFLPIFGFFFAFVRILSIFFNFLDSIEKKPHFPLKTPKSAIYPVRHSAFQAQPFSAPLLYSVPSIMVNKTSNIITCKQTQISRFSFVIIISPILGSAPHPLHVVCHRFFLRCEKQATSVIT